MDMQSWVILAANVIVGVIISVVGYLVKNQYEDLKSGLKTIRDELISFREDVLRNYATKADLQKDENDNKASHSKMWDELNGIRERLVAQETMQKMKRTR